MLRILVKYYVVVIASSSFFFLFHQVHSAVLITAVITEFMCLVWAVRVEGETPDVLWHASLNQVNSPSLSSSLGTPALWKLGEAKE